MRRPTRSHWLALLFWSAVVVTAILARVTTGLLWAGVYWSAPFAIWFVMVTGAVGYRLGRQAGVEDGAHEVAERWRESVAEHHERAVCRIEEERMRNAHVRMERDSLLDQAITDLATRTRPVTYVFPPSTVEPGEPSDA